MVKKKFFFYIIYSILIQYLNRFSIFCFTIYRFIVISSEIILNFIISISFFLLVINIYYSFLQILTMFKTELFFKLIRTYNFIVNTIKILDLLYLLFNLFISSNFIAAIRKEIELVFLLVSLINFSTITFFLLKNLKFYLYVWEYNRVKLFLVLIFVTFCKFMFPFYLFLNLEELSK